MKTPRLSVHALFPLLFVTACSASPNAASSAPAAQADAGAAVDEAPDGATTKLAAACPEGTPFSQSSGKVVANVSFDGGNPVKAIFDTGASRTLVASSLGTSGGAVDVAVAGRTVSLDRVIVDDAALATLRMPEIKAVIGVDVFEKFALTLDYPRGRMMLDEKVDDEAYAACTHLDAVRDWIPFKSIGGTTFVRGKMEDEEGWLILDTGASLGVVTESTFQALVAKKPHAALGGFYTPAALGTFWAKLTAVGSLDVAGVHVEHVVSRTIDDALLGSGPAGAPLMGVVPSDFFGRTLVTFDYPQHRVRFAVGKGESARLASRFFPIGISLEEHTDAPVRVAAVLPGSAAAEADVAAGDEIVTIAGHDAAKMDPYARAFGLGAASAGVTVAVKVRRGQDERTLSLEARDLL